MDKKDIVCVGYCRVSPRSKKIPERFTLDMQQKAIQEYCNSKSWKLINTFTDRDKSAKDFNRTEWGKIEILVTEKKIDLVVVYKFDRFSRNTADGLNKIKWLASNDVGIVSIIESLDTTTPIGKIMLTMLLALAELERDTTIQRTEAVQWEIFEEKDYPLSRPPYGYMAIKAQTERGDKVIRWDINAKEEDNIKIVFFEYTNGASINTCAKAIGISLQRTQHILQNKTYLGMYGYKKEWKKGNHKPIITKEVFDKAQERLSKEKKTRIMP